MMFDNKDVAYPATQESGLVLNAFVTKVYGWMTAALTITAMVALWAVQSGVAEKIIGTPIFMGLIIFELILVVALVWGLNKLPVILASLMFIFYSAINGLTISFIFFMYTEGSIAGAFAISAGMFGAMSIYGYVTKSDLTSIGNLCLMGLFGIIIASVVNIFLQSSAMYWVTTYIGVAVFLGLTAYDTQKIKQMSRYADNSSASKKAAIMGALALYLDFINLFLFILRIMGNRR